MLKVRSIFVLILMVVSLTSFSQFLRNEGKLVLASGGQINIQGNYQNEESGEINSSGVIILTGNWTNNGTSNAFASPLNTNNEVVFAGTTQTIGGNSSIFDFQKITINSGSTTQVEAGKGITAYGACTFTSPLVLKSSTTPFRPIMATFINKSTVNGDITMELSYTSTGSSSSGTGRGLYFSSPISNATTTIFDVAAGLNLLWYQDEVAKKYVKIVTNGTALTNAKGYILRTSTSQVFSFTGTPNTASSYSNSNIPRTIASQYYLMGNPYPAVIDWQSIATKTNLTNTVWYQTSTTTGAMVVDTWNGNSLIGTNNNGTSSVDGKIPPMQSFWVQVSNVGLTGTLTIDNNARTHNFGNSKFLKSRANSSANNLTRLYLYSSEKRDEAIIVQSEFAQDPYDSWDSRKMLLKDPSRAELFTLSPEKTNLVIQSIKPISKDKQIKLGISIGVSGEYKFVADLSEDSNTNNIFLEDKKLKVMQDLLVNPQYTFTSDIVDDTSRFVIHYLQAPTININSSIVKCSPETVDLTTEAIASGTTSDLVFTYWTDAAATTPYSYPTKAETGIYYIKGTASNSTYKISSPIAVTINAAPVIVTTNPTPVISPSTVDLTLPNITLGSTLGLSYSYWLDQNGTIPFNTPQIATAGNYYIKGIVDATGCFAIAGPVTVIVNPITLTDPTLNLGDITIYSCNNQIFILNCSPNSTIEVYDIIGHRYYSGVAKSDKEVISRSYNSGIYIVRVTTDQFVKSKKVFLK